MGIFFTILAVKKIMKSSLAGFAIQVPVINLYFISINLLNILNIYSTYFRLTEVGLFNHNFIWSALC